MLHFNITFLRCKDSKKGREYKINCYICSDYEENKDFFLMILLQMLPLMGAMATKRAFLVGIGSYPPKSGWHFIHSANDIFLIEKPLKKALL
jgi:hypothetical protein